MKFLFGNMRYWRKRSDVSVALSEYGDSLMDGCGWGDEGEDV